MLTILILLLVAGGVAWRALSQDQRLNALLAVDAWLAIGVDAYRTHGREELAAFRAAIRARGRWPLVTVSLAAVSAAAFLLTRSGGLAQNDPGALLAAGASFGPRTSNGEWWRLATAIFVHATLISLIVDVAAVVQIGWTLERIVGRAAVVEAFLGGGLITGLAGLSRDPTGVVTSAAGAVAGAYGLFAIVAAATHLRRSPITIPLAAFERLLPIAVIFFVHAAGDPNAGAGPFAGFACGGFVGLVALKGLQERTPPPRRMALTVAAGVIVAAGLAVSLRGILDVRPEIDRVVQLERRTADTYRSAAERFQKGRMTADDLARMIDRDIVPEFLRADAHLSVLRGVPTDDVPRVAEAREYLHLRTTSWQLRAEGLRMTDRSVRGATKIPEDSDVAFRVRAQTLYQSAQMAAGRADGAESASLDAFARLRPPPGSGSK